MLKRKLRERCPESWIFKMKKRAEVKYVSRLSRKPPLSTRVLLSTREEFLTK
jgi:hypothetical protein